VVLIAGTSALAGCGSTIGDNTPHLLGGLPADAPQRPAKQSAYPAVHDFPPPRKERRLSAEEQKQLEAELIAAGERNSAAGERNSAAGERNSAAADATGSARKP
jgi:hypothetical protein